MNFLKKIFKKQINCGKAGNYMEKILVNFNILIAIVFFYQRFRHGLHILQLENYYNDRYAVWMKRYIRKIFDIKIIISLFIPIFLFIFNKNIIALVLNILIYLGWIICFKRPKEKKAFVTKFFILTISKSKGGFLII